MMSGQGLLGKQVMFEQSAVVPYLVRLPGKSPQRYSGPVSHIDFAPTMLDLLGKPPHSQCVGQSKASLMRGEVPTPGSVFLQWAPSQGGIDVSQSRLASKEAINTCLGESTRAVVSPDGWKVCLRDKDKNELYNLRDDPAERQNLFYENSEREVVGRLSAEIHRWQQRIGDKVKV